MERKAAHPESQLEIRQLWGDTVLRLERFPLLGRVRVGSRRDCAFFVPPSVLPAERFPVVAAEGGQAWLQLAHGFAGEIEQEGQRRPIGELIAAGDAAPATDAGLIVFRLPIEPGMRIRLVIGPLVLLLVRVRPVDPVPARFRQRLDYRFLGVLLGLMALFLAGGLVLVTLALAMPPVDRLARGLVVDLPSLLFQPVREPPLPSSPSRETHHGSPGPPAGRRMDGDPGRRGIRAASFPKSAGGAFHREGALDPFRGLDLPPIFGAGPGSGARAGVGGQIVADGAGRGQWLRGNGPGGGGQNRLHAGLGQEGRGPGRRGGAGCDDFCGGDSSGKTEVAIAIGGDQATMTGGSDPSLIDAVVKRHLDQLRYCYEKALLSRPGLTGKVVVGFRIGAEGRVQGAFVASSTLADLPVETCLTARFGTFLFPRPRGGGEVTVRYPLLFKSDG